MGGLRWFGWGLLLVALLVGSAAGLGTGEESGERVAEFQAAVDAYRTGDLETARALFEELKEDAASPRDRAILLGNLGNIAFREERLFDAVALFTAATRSEPRNRDLWHNLELARAKAGLEPADPGDLAGTVAHLLALPTGAELRGAGWLLVGLLAVALGVEILRGGRGPKIAAVLIVALLAADLTLSEVRAAGAAKTTAMIVAPSGVELSSEPQAGRGLGIRLGPASEVVFIDRLGTEGQPGAWAKVRSEAGTGWIPAEGVLAW